MTYINMVRTQVYLTTPIYQGIKVLSKKENKPTAEVIRELLEIGLKKKATQKSTNALLKIADNAVHSSITDLSTNLDTYLYE